MKYENFAKIEATIINTKERKKIFSLPIFKKLKSGKGKFSDLLLELFKMETIVKEEKSLLIDINIKNETKKLRITVESDFIKLSWVLHRKHIPGIHINYSYVSCEEEIIYKIKKNKIINNKKFNEIVFSLESKELTSIEFTEMIWDDSKKMEPAIFKTILTDLDKESNQYLINLKTMGNDNFISILKDKILVTIPNDQSMSIEKELNMFGLEIKINLLGFKSNKNVIYQSTPKEIFNKILHINN